MVNSEPESKNRAAPKSSAPVLNIKNSRAVSKAEKVKFLAYFINSFKTDFRYFFFGVIKSTTKAEYGGGYLGYSSILC